MKLIKEYITKVLIIIFFLSLSLEICVFIFIYRNSKNIYTKLFNDTLDKAAKKSKESIEMINNFTGNLFMNYMNKLKLISKHTLLYNGNVNNDNIINMNSKIFSNKNLLDKIIRAKKDEIYKKQEFQDLFNETTEKFEYIQSYMEKYKNVTNNLLLNKLLREHDELNYISYHNCLDSEFDLNNLEEEDVKKLNFLIPIFKSIFLERLITKREKMDIMRIFILTPNELIIYPPEDASKIYLYNTNDDEIYCSWEPYETYYSCVYDYITRRLPSYENYMFFIEENNDFYNYIYSICVHFSYVKGDNANSMLCIDVNFGYMINSFDYLKTKNFDFGLARVLMIWEPDFHFDFFAIFNSNRNVSEIIEVFNSSEYTPEKFVIKDDKYNYYSFYNILYLETTKIIKEHPELNMNITELDIEYENTFNSIINLISDITIGKLIEGIFNKTSCRKKNN